MPNPDEGYNKALQRINKAAESKATELNLSGLGLSSLPPEIVRLTSLTKLYLSNNNLSSLPPEIARLTSLTELYLGNNNLSSLPPEIARLTLLTALDLSYNNLSSLPPEIARLTLLTALDLSYNNLSSLPPEIARLTSLTALDLDNNNLSSLPPEICRLTSLTELYLHNNKLTSLPPEICWLTSLTELYLHNNKLSSLPPEIARLTSLTKLSLYYNNLSSLPPEIARLTSLTKLYLGSNKLSSLPPEICCLTSLTALYLDNNGLSNLPPKIARLTSLTKLYLGSNKLSSLPPEIVSLNIPFKWENWDTKDGIYLKGNPLKEPPPEIIKQGRAAVIEYFKSPREAVYEAKLIVVGQGEVGKTCLCNRLIHDKYKEQPTTQGIAIKKGWEITAPDGTPIKTNVWDFGGQEIYHSTHQFFLTKRSVYILVWDNRKGEEAAFLDYWLYTVETLAADSPIIVVLNKCDNPPLTDTNRADYKERFKQVKEFYRVSCKLPAKGPDTFQQLLKQISCDMRELPQMGDMWPRPWLAVRKALETDNRNQMSYEEYQNICAQKQVTAKTADILSQYLHDLGIILHFKDDPVLKDTIILKPEWGTNAVYKVLSARCVQKHNGLLKRGDLHHIWKAKDGYPQTKHETLLTLMCNFKLAFKMAGTTNYIIPELLSKQPPDFDWDNNDNLRFQYEYSFMPAGILPRFIVRRHENLQRNAKGDYACWREGALLDIDGAAVYIKATVGERKIEIKISGKHKSEALAVIRNELNKINDKFHKITITKMVPCNCLPDCPKFFDYDILRKKEEKKMRDELCDISSKFVSIEELLNGVESKEKRYSEYAQQRGVTFVKKEQYITHVHKGGQAGNTGKIKADSVTINQRQENIQLDFKTLTDELSLLRKALKAKAADIDDEELDEAVSQVAKARKAAEAKDGAGVIAHLKKAGAWAFDTATQIGVTAAVRIITPGL